MKILITGGNGYVAKSLSKALSEDYSVVSISREDFDLSDSSKVYDWFAGNNELYDVIIHTAITGGNRLSQDSSETIDQNVKMYYNLLSCRGFYSRFINLGSGAEVCAVDTPYGLSKKVVSESISDKDNFFNLRIFAAFDDSEPDRRFIRSNIINYINKRPIELYSNKMMDFFYMKDLASLVRYYIENESPPKQIDCCYEKSKTLPEIARYINQLSDHRVELNIDAKKERDYCGHFLDLGISYIGLENGIKETYNRLLP